MIEKSILIVGRKLASDTLTSVLVSGGWHISLVDTIEDAQERMASGNAYHVVVVDTHSAGRPVLERLESLHLADQDAAIILVVQAGSPPDFLGGGRVRPSWFLVRPQDQVALSMSVESAFLYRKLIEENRTLKRQMRSAASLNDWVGCSPEAQEVRNSIATAALGSGPVLMLGEDGSGRRLAAELIHRNGRDSGASFLPIELTSLPEGELADLLEEISGGRRGNQVVPFSQGIFPPGALYLSELSSLSASDQKILAEFAGQKLPFRLMASADTSIKEAVRLGRFNRRLYQWLSSLTIYVPPLRERRADIPVLIDHFLRRACERLGLKSLGIPSGAIENYTTHDWPGNVAELSMVIERAISIASAAKFEGTTLPEHFCASPSLTRDEPSRLKSVSLRELIADIEKRIIIQTLERVDGSQKRAAEKLRLNPTTLHEKMKRYKIRPEKSRARSVAI